MAVEKGLAGYHIARPRPSACGTRLIIMQDMVGMAEFPWNSPNHAAAFPRRKVSARVLARSPLSRGRRESRVPNAPAALRVKIETRKLVTTGSPDQPGLPCAMVLTVYSALSLVIGLSCHHHRQIVFADLISASRYQDHAASPSASMRIVFAQRLRPSHPAPNVRDDREAPLLRCAGRPKEMAVICPTEQAERLRHVGTTGKSGEVAEISQVLSNCCRHCEERKRRSYPESCRHALDCFAYARNEGD